MFSRKFLSNRSNYNMSGWCYTDIEASQLIFSANQLTGFYMNLTLARRGLKAFRNTNLRIGNEDCNHVNEKYLEHGKISIQLDIGN